MESSREKRPHEALVFRIGTARFALENQYIDQVYQEKKLHRLPWLHQNNILGIVEVRGRPRICVSLHTLLGESQEAVGTNMVACAQGVRIVFPVDAIEGTVALDLLSDARLLDTAFLLQAFSLPKPGTIEPTPPFQDTRALFREEVAHSTAKILQLLFQHEKIPPSDEVLLEIIRDAHAIKSACQLMGLKGIATLAQTVEGSCTAFLGKNALFSPHEFQQLVQLIDTIQKHAEASSDLSQEAVPHSDTVKVEASRIAELISEVQGSLNEAETLLKRCKGERGMHFSDFALLLSTHLTNLQKLYATAVTTTMLPFAGATMGLQRQVHEYAATLHKEVN